MCIRKKAAILRQASHWLRGGPDRGRGSRVDGWHLSPPERLTRGARVSEGSLAVVERELPLLVRGARVGRVTAGVWHGLHSSHCSFLLCSLH